MERQTQTLHLLRVLASLPHDLVQYHCQLEGLVGCSPLVRELRARVGGIERQVHDRRKLAEISEEKTGASSKHLLGVVREGLAETSVLEACLTHWGRAGGTPRPVPHTALSQAPLLLLGCFCGKTLPPTSTIPR